jgi:hypothetical protein
MNSTKCRECGLVYWETSPTCLRCGTETVQPQPIPSPYSAGALNKTANPLSPEDAQKEKLLKDLRNDSRFFYFIGVLQSVVWFIVGNLLIVDGLCNIGLSFLTRKFRSRAAAITLLIFTLFSVLAAFYFVAQSGHQPSVIFPLVLLFRVIASGRMVYCTFKLRKYVLAESVPFLPPPPPVFQTETGLPPSQ